MTLLNHAHTWSYPILFLNAIETSARGVGNFATKLVAVATSLEESEKLDRIKKIHVFGEKIVKISPVDTEIALFILKKKKKLRKVKYIA